MGMTPVELAAARMQLRRDNAAAPAELEPVPRARWPRSRDGSRVLAVWRSRGFRVVQYRERSGHERLTVNRTMLGPDGRWEGGITWDELMQVKRQAGLGDRWAVEIYPADAAAVDVASMRHLWLLDEPPAYAWGAER